MPGSGEVLAFSTVSQQNGTATSVPLHDLVGSTLGLVGSDNLLDSQFTYDPAGNVATSGQSSPFPFLYGGMEFDPTGYYRASSGYYSPTLNRLLSGGATAFSGAGIRGQGVESMPSTSGSSGGGLDAGAQAAIDVSVTAASVAALIFLGSPSFAAGASESGIPGLAPILTTVVSVLDAIIGSIVDLFGGGGGSNPPPLAAKAFKPFHAPECDFIGTAIGLCPSLQAIGTLEAAAAVYSNDRAPGGNIERVQFSSVPSSGCSYYDDLCKQSKGTDRYACSAGRCCREYGSNTIANCVRDCLIQEDQSVFELFEPL